MIFHHCFRLQSRMDKYSIVTWPFEVSTIVEFSGMFKKCVSIFARYDLFSKIDRIKIIRNKYINGVLVFFLLGIIFVAATYIFFRIPFKKLWEYNYGIYAAIFICFFKKYVVRIPVISKILIFFGKHSMNIFLIHTFIQSVFFMDFIFGFKHFLLIAAVLFGISLAISVLIIEPLKKLVRFDKLMDKLSNKFCELIDKS